MGENELIEEELSPNQVNNSVDFSPIINSLNDLIQKQGEIIENQNKIIDYFIPTEEELIQIEKDKQEEQEKILIQEEEELLIQEEKEREIQEYNNQILTLLREIKEDFTKGNEVNAISSGTNYTLLVVLVSFIFFGLLYKVLKIFI